jgi:hypothetical protein
VSCSGDEIWYSGQCGRFETGQSNGMVSDDSVVWISREGGWTAKDDAKPVLGRERITLYCTVENPSHQPAPTLKSVAVSCTLRTVWCLCILGHGHLRHCRAQITSHKSTRSPRSEVCLAPAQAQEAITHLELAHSVDDDVEIVFDQR